jgi:hypothetical protein
MFKSAGAYRAAVQRILSVLSSGEKRSVRDVLLKHKENCLINVSAVTELLCEGSELKPLTV